MDNNCVNRTQAAEVLYCNKLYIISNVNQDVVCKYIIFIL